MGHIFIRVSFRNISRSSIRLGRVRDTHITKAPQKHLDRRKFTRYQVRIPVMFSWTMSWRQRSRTEGIVRDISTSGVYVHVGDCPPVDSSIVLEVAFPTRYGGSNCTIKARMKVLRVDKDLSGDGLVGFAAAGKEFSVRRIVTDK